ncbi:MAG: type II toxin-antitoxin system RelB/DinJ family antitoxin [Defluviitaleaceae bacterium]|nr:type II toxin-antitoxin system RelB/DinJ family antitoxin [Defluviitaleaceae bacterium]
MATIQVRVDDRVKSSVEELFGKLGMDVSTAVRMFFSAALEYDGIPFALRRTPNARLRAAIEEAEQIAADIKAGRRKPYATAEEMFAAMDAEDEAEGYDV